MANSAYGNSFYQDQIGGSLKSARIMVPKILEIVGAQSVCDVGCGMGTWLRAYQENALSDIMGFDGPWVSEKQGLVGGDAFTIVDLADPGPAPRRFDLAQTLEVAEHIHADKSDAFVRFLTELSNVIVFGAAIPHQGGTHHINEQWPDYWRAKFEALGYVGLDPFREVFWDNLEVEYWYAQNTFLFVRKDCHAEFDGLPRMDAHPGWPERLIHPRLLAHKAAILEEPGLGLILRKSPSAFVRTLKRKMGLGSPANR
jgi:hypothetical protein